MLSLIRYLGDMKGEELINAHVFKDTPKQMDLLLDKIKDETALWILPCQVLFEGDSVVQLSNHIMAFITVACFVM